MGTDFAHLAVAVGRKTDSSNENNRFRVRAYKYFALTRYLYSLFTCLSYLAKEKTKVYGAG